MTERHVPSHQLGDLVGIIRHRLLINRWVDPDEVASLLPVDVRPRVGSGGGVVVGCCLIAIEAARPWPFPAAIGSRIFSAAHRISVEVGPPDAPTAAVYVPMRHSDSRPTVAIGGRLFPGVHHRSQTAVDYSDNTLGWEIRSTGSKRKRESTGDGFDIAVTAERAGARPAVSEVADIVIGTSLGISPGHHGRLEGAEMLPASTSADEVELVDLRSEFLDGFHSAQDAETLLMTDVGVTWRRAPVPSPRNAMGAPT